jgi:hypothetical protein
VGGLEGDAQDRGANSIAPVMPPADPAGINKQLLWCRSRLSRGLDLGFITIRWSQR